MWSFSTGVMLRQNRRAWLKWSSNVAESSRSFTPSGTRTGRSSNAPSLSPARNGQPPSSEFGR